MTDIQLQATWEEILKNLENSLSTRVCNNWLKPLKPIKLTTEMLELGAPNVFTKNWVEKYYLPFFPLAQEIFCNQGNHKSTALNSLLLN